MEGDDATRHLHWIAGFADLLRAGVWVPRWLPDGFRGFGSPVFYFYPPLTYYASSLISIVTGIRNPVTLFNLTGLFATLASGATCYWFLQKLQTSKQQSLIGAVFFAFAPYRIFDLYTRSSITQHFAFIFIPLIAGALYLGYERRHQLLPNILLPISWACLLLSSLPLSAAIALTLLFLWLIQYKALNSNFIVQTALGLALGTALTAYHYLPAAYFRSYIQPSQFAAIGAGNWLTEILKGRNLRFDLHSILLFGTHAAFMFAWLKNRSKWRDNALFRTAAILFAIFLILETPFISGVIWNAVPPLKFIQFYTRFGIVTVLVLAILFAIHNSETQKIAGIALVAWSIAAIFFSIVILADVKFHPHDTNAWTDAPEYLPKTINASTAMDSVLLPQEHKPFVLPNRALVEGESIVVDTLTPLTIIIRSVLSKPAQLMIHQFSWPTWHVLIDGKPTASTTDNAGRTQVDMASGSHSLQLQLVTSPVERTGAIGSLLGLLAALFLVGCRFYLRSSSKLE